MQRQATVVAYRYIAGLLIIAALAGCGRMPAEPAELSSPQEGTPGYGSTRNSGYPAPPTESGRDAVVSKDTMHISSSTTEPPVSYAAPAAAPSAAPNLPAAEPSKPVGKSEAQAAPAQPKPKVDAEDAYKEENPTLLGLTLHTERDAVLAKLGNAKNKFTMDDDADPITVYEYADFSVGFNKDNRLEFVDVHSPDIDPGLHGLRIGQSVDDAVKALGKPDTSSTVVLTYRTQGTVLKLDLDAKSGLIRSIKLFASK
ncbi:hypothetical protein ACFFK0_01525 [Paenibacillus chartarius]|uniref:DUF4309 domain-containing protein n=1 Tax=Paenibacillus chartarius TaxID=747481 RepID=A0ABV6DER3_9BACL